MRAIAATLGVLMACWAPATAQVPISEQLEAAEHEHEMWGRWTGMTRWGMGLAGGFALASSVGQQNSRALGIGALSGVTLIVIGVVAHLNQRQLERRIDTLKAMQSVRVAPLPDGVYAGYQMGW